VDDEHQPVTHEKGRSGGYMKFNTYWGGAKIKKLKTVHQKVFSSSCSVSFRILDFSFFCGPEENLLTGAEHGDVLQTAVDVQFKDTPLPKNRWITTWWRTVSGVKFQTQHLQMSWIVMFSILKRLRNLLQSSINPNASQFADDKIMWSYLKTRHFASIFSHVAILSYSFF
jgi:hypothetical protein